MNIEVLISIISVCVTLLLGVVGFIANSFIQRKSHSIQVITKTRLARREKTKELTAKMIVLSDVEYLDTIESKDIVIQQVVEVFSNLRAEYSNVFRCDKVLLETCESLKDSVIKYIKHKDNKEVLLLARNEFIKVSDLYIQTEWKRIKLETVGKMKNKKNIQSWDEIYNGYSKEYK